MTKNINNEVYADKSISFVPDPNYRPYEVRSEASEFWKRKYDDKASLFWHRFYQKNQDKFFKNRYWITREFPQLLEGTVGAKQRKRLMEVGCGVGNTAFPLWEECYPYLEVFCFDFAPEAISIIKQTLQRAVETAQSKNVEQARQLLDSMSLTSGSSNATSQQSEEDVDADGDVDMAASQGDIAAKNEAQAMLLLDAKRAQERLDTLHPFVHDASSVSIPSSIVADESIDYATCIFVLSAMSLEQMRRAALHIAQKMRSGGIIFVRDYASNDMAQTRFHVKGKDEMQKLDERFYVRGDGTRAYYFTRSELQQLFGCLPSSDNNDEAVSSQISSLVPQGLFRCIECQFVEKRVTNVAERKTMDRIFIQAKFERIQESDAWLVEQDIVFGASKPWYRRQDWFAARCWIVLTGREAERP